MTKFTAALSQPSQVGGPTDPGPMPSGLEGLGNTLNQVASSMSRNDTRRRQRAADRADARAAATEDTAALTFMEHGAALNELERSLKGTGAVEQADRLDTMVEGHQQGNISRSTLDLRLETEVMRFIRDNPDQAAEYVDYMQARGFDSYIFRNIESAQQERDNRRDVEQAATAAAYNTAVENMPADQLQNLSYGEVAGLGQRITVEQNELSRLQEASRLEMERASLSNTRSTRARAELDRELGQAAIRLGSTRLTPVTMELSSLWRQNPEDREFLREGVPLVRSAIMQEYNRIVAEAVDGDYATEGFVEELTRFRDDVIEGLTIYSEDTSFDGVREAYLDRLETDMEINIIETAPVLARLMRLNPQAGGMVVDTLARGHIEDVEPEMRALLSGDNSPAAMAGFGETLIRADMRLHPEVSERELDNIVGRLNGNGRAIMAEEPDQRLVNGFSQDYMDFLDYSEDENVRGQLTGPKLLSAVDLLFSSERAAQLDALEDHDPSHASILQNAAAAEAERLLSAGRQIQTGINGWNIQFNENTGQFEHVLTSRGLATPASATRMTDLTGRGPAMPVPPSSLIDNVVALNTLVSWVEDFLPDESNLTSRELRRMIALGPDSVTEPEDED